MIADRGPAPLARGIINRLIAAFDREVAAGATHSPGRTNGWQTIRYRGRYRSAAQRSGFRASSRDHHPDTKASDHAFVPDIQAGSVPAAERVQVVSVQRYGPRAFARRHASPEHDLLIIDDPHATARTYKKSRINPSDSCWLTATPACDGRCLAASIERDRVPAVRN